MPCHHSLAGALEAGSRIFASRRCAVCSLCSQQELPDNKFKFRF
jgi:hypothetical protein